MNEMSELLEQQIAGARAVKDCPMERDHTAIADCLAGLLLDRYQYIALAILYGSVARGREHPGSDIDLAIAMDARSPCAGDTLVDISLACGEVTGYEVQVRDLARAQGLYLREVLTSGIVIVDRDPSVRAELLIRMLDFTEDMLPAIRRIRAANTARFISGGNDGRA